MKLALLLPLLAVAFETSHAKDVARGDGGRLRALQEELSMPGDLSLAGIEIEIATPEVSPANFIGSKSSKQPTLSPAPSSSELCPGVIKSSKSGKKGVTYCLDQDCGQCVALYTLFEEQGCWDLITEDPFDQCLALPAIEELLLNQIPKCLLLVVYGFLAGCIGEEPPCDPTCYPESAWNGADVAVAGSGSGSGTLFGLTMNDLNDYARANLPQNITF
jgi:hypothetical protein